MSKQFFFTLRVYVEDTDFGGVVYHSNYLNFMERARTEWLASESLGIDEFAKMDLFFVVRHAEIDYRQPARLNNELLITSSVSQIKHSSVRFSQQISLKSDPNTILCEGKIHLVCINQALRPVRVPDVLREVMT